MRKLDIVASRTYNDGGKKIECGQILGSLYIGDDTDAVALLASIQYGPLQLVEDDEPDDDDDEPADPADDDESWYEGADEDSDDDSADDSDDDSADDSDDEPGDDSAEKPDDDQSQLEIAGDDADLSVVILQADPKVPARILESLAAAKLATVGDAKKYWAENKTFNALEDIGERTTQKLVAILSLTDPDDDEASGSDDE